MKIVRGFGKLLKPLVNFPAWMGWKQIKATSVGIKDIAKGLTQQEKAKRTETFEQAVARLHLTPEKLAEKQKQFLQTTIFYAVIAAGLLIYAIYMLIYGHLAASFLSLVLTVLAGTLAFRQHFCYYQIKRQKLGCTIKEWFRDLIHF